MYTDPCRRCSKYTILSHYTVLCLHSIGSSWSHSNWSQYHVDRVNTGQYVIRNAFTGLVYVCMLTFCSDMYIGTYVHTITLQGFCANKEEICIAMQTNCTKITVINRTLCIVKNTVRFKVASW